jgi:tetratricopeptide (TPR) repeat protein
MGIGGIGFRSRIGKLGPALLALVLGCRASPDLDEVRTSPVPSNQTEGLGLRFGRWLEVEAEERTLAALREACLLEQVGESEEAMEHLSGALEELGPSPSLLEARGALYLCAGYPRAAAGDFQEAVRLAPERPDAWFALGHAYELLGLSHQALETLDRAVALGAWEAGAFLARARVLRSLGRAGLAAKDYDSALEGSEGRSTEILVEAVMLARADPSTSPQVEAFRERLEACRGTVLSDDAWLLRALLKELRGGTEEEVRTAFLALDVAPAELVLLAHSLLWAIQLADAETRAAARQELIEGETDADRRLRFERCLSLP